MVDPVIWTGEQLVNTTTAGNQGYASVAALADGGYVVVWESDGNPSVIQGQMYDAFGQKNGGELLISNAISAQHFPAVVGLDGGGFLVSWNGAQDTGKINSAVVGAVYYPDGTLRGTPYVISGDIDPIDPGQQHEAVMAKLPDGTIAIAYQSSESDGSTVVKLQMLDAAGGLSGSEKIIATDASASLDGLSIGSLGDGRIGLSWAADDDPGDHNVYMQVLDGSGDKIGVVIPVATGPDVQNDATIAGDGSGGFVVEFHDGSSALGESQSMGTQYYPPGMADVAPSLISEQALNGGQTSSGVLVAKPGGGYFALWMEYGGGTEQIVGRQLDAAGAPVGDEFHLYSVPMDVASPYAQHLQAALLHDGRIVLTWEDNQAAEDGDGYGVHSMIVDPRHGVIAGTPDADLLAGSSDGTADTIQALGGDDKLYGFDGDDHLYGGDGSDMIWGGLGDDTMEGGANDDYYFVTDAGDVVVEDAAGGFDTVQANVGYTLTAGAHVETLVVASIDALQVAGNEFDNTIVGGAGFDTLLGGGGNDTFMEDNSNVTMKGGAGDDTYIIGGADEIVVEAGTEGTDTVVLQGSTYTLGANLENLVMDPIGAGVTGTGNGLANRITGNFIANTLSGLDGNDTLDGGGGLDTLKGGKGNDTYVLGGEHDVVIDTGGADDRVTSTISRKLTSYTGIENLSLAGSGNVNAVGNGVANDLVGNAGNNSLSGGAGNDLLRGGGGWDKLVGGAGKDRFDFDKAIDIGAAKGARDIVRDFHHAQDRIDLSTIDASTAAGSQAFKFAAQEGKHFTGARGQLIWDQQNHSGTAHDVTIVSGDIDGDKAADFTLELSGLVHLTQGDFVL